MKTITGLLEKLNYRVIDGALDGEVSALVYDSRKVTKDCMFVCIKGAAAMSIRKRLHQQVRKLLWQSVR